jgi:uncharacterized protein YjbJ (UPF0337 family)
MNNDRVEGKVKDVAGRIERQAGEWTGNTTMQVRGTAKQAEGKIQNAVGKVKNAVKTTAERDPDSRDLDSEETQEVDIVPESSHRRP